MVLLSWPFTEKDIEAQRALVIAGSSKIESRFTCKDSDLISHTLNYWLQKLAHGSLMQELSVMRHHGEEIKKGSNIIRVTFTLRSMCIWIDCRESTVEEKGKKMESTEVFWKYITAVGIRVVVE